MARTFLRIPSRLALALLVFGSPAHAAAQVTCSGSNLRISGNARLGEQGTGSWSAAFQCPPVQRNGGILPVTAGWDGRPVTAPWEALPSFRWDFGDLTPAVESGTHSVVRHQYLRNGAFTITVTASSGEVTETATFDVVVVNRAPRLSRIQALEVPSSRATVEFSVDAEDSPEDVLEYRWDFGDGEQDAGPGMWRAVHSYAAPGSFQIVVEVGDPEGASDADTLDLEVGQGQGNAVAAVDGDEGPAITESVLAATVGGVLSTKLDAKVRSTMGVYLMPVSSGMCRLTFTAWDDAHLAKVVTWVDLPGLPEGSGTISFGTPPVYATFYADPGVYRTFRTLRSGGVEDVLRMFGSTSPGLASRIGAILGVTPGGPEEAPDQIEPGAPLVGSRADFRTTGGELELTIVPGNRIDGTFDLTMVNTDKDPESAPGQINLSGTLGLDLQDAMRRGMVRAQDCGPARFFVESVSPDDGEKNTLTHPFVGVQFNAPYDPATLDQTTLQVGYPDPSAPGGFRAVPGHLLRGNRSARFVPDQDLLGGVRYTLRLKAGAEGINSRNGTELEDEQGGDWLSWTFETKVDFASPAAPGHDLSCNVYQTIRDAPLVRGKPAVVRVQADWSELAGVPPELQVTEIQASVELRDQNRNLLATAPYTFVRPDLWESAGIDRRLAEHTANVFGWTPTGEEGTRVDVSLRVPTGAERQDWRYFTSCPITHWSESPTMTVDYYLLGVDTWAWTQDGWPDWASAALSATVAASESYALQVHPLRAIQGRIRGPLQLGRISGCTNQCAAATMSAAVGAWTAADAVVGFGPFGLAETRSGQGEMGGFTKSGGTAGTSFVTITLQPPETGEVFDRLVEGLVHEYGHAFELEHLPAATTDTTRKPIVAMRNNSLLWYQGTEGFRMARSGRRGWNKSSTEGNAETPRRWLVPLMFPGTIPTGEAFVANHQYRLAQAFWAARGDVRPASGEFRDAPAPRLLPRPGRSAAMELSAPKLQVAAPTVTLAGLLDEAGHPTLVTGLVRGRHRVGDGAGSTRGGYRAALLDGNGQVLSTSSFEPNPQGSDGSGSRPFSVSLNWEEGATHLLISRDGTVLLDRARSARPPTIEIVPTAGDSPGVSWMASDADGDSLSIAVLYAPEPGSAWTVLALGQPARGSLPFDPTWLEPGPSPTVRVVASDGFDQTAAEGPAHVDTGFHVLAAFPSGDHAVPDQDMITVMFNANLGPLPDGVLTVMNDKGEPVEMELIDPEGGRTLLARPAAPFEAGRTYQATLNGDLADRGGEALSAPFAWSFRVAR